VLASLLLASSSPAALLTVTTASDSGPGSLRAAMDAANTTPALDIIQFNIAPAVTPVGQTEAQTSFNPDPDSYFPSARRTLICAVATRPASSMACSS
jgi:hypothetical protein